jgi:hypothetical protein
VQGKCLIEVKVKHSNLRKMRRGSTVRHFFDLLAIADFSAKLSSQQSSARHACD